MGSAKKNETPEEREVRLKKKREQERRRRARPEVAEHIKSYKAKHNDLHQAKIKIHRAAYRAANRDKIRASQKAYRIANCGKLATYRSNNAAVISARNARYNLDAKTELIRIYSRNTFKCANCAEARFGALTVEHENGDGGGFKRMIKGPLKVFNDLKKHGFPPGIKILCSNCNIKGYLRRAKSRLSASSVAIRRRDASKRTKAEFMNRLGGRCAVCGISDVDVLTVHHINGDGAAHRRMICAGKGGIHFYRQVVAFGDFTGLECRCFNCNDEEEWRPSNVTEG